MPSKAASSTDVRQWTLVPLPGDAPARDLASLVLHDKQMYLFGGRDAQGKASSTLWRLDISTLDSRWQAVQCTGGKVPAARWGHSAFVWGEQMWVYGGTSDSGKPLDDLHRFDFTSAAWVAVEQSGCIPDRQWRSPPQRTFQRAVAHGATLLAFGTEQQDENVDPNSAKAASSAALMLHSMDLCTSTWYWKATHGSPGFSHVEGLLVADHKLLALGWTPQAQGSKDDIHMQVSYLDLVHSGSSPPSWVQLDSTGVVPTARSGCAIALCPSDTGDLLVLHGGMLCSPTVQGLLTAEAYCLDLATGQWTMMQPSIERSFGLPAVGVPRINHTAVAVPEASSVLLLGGTSSLSAYASCTAVECLQLVSGEQDMGPGDAGSGSGLLRALRQPGDGKPQSNVGVRVTGHGLSVQHDFRPFVFNELMSDVTLVTHDTSIPAHRLILAACPKFLSMMNQEATYTKPVERKWKVYVQDLYPDVLRLILRYLYGCLEAITADEAPLLFSASSRYGLPAMRQECVKVLIGSLSLETAPTFAMLAHEHSCPDLMQACVGYAAASPERLSQLLGSPSYLHLTEACPRVGQAFVHAAMQQLLAK